jgi:glutaredoxin
VAEQPVIDAVEFYWRPGCGFCSSLARRLDAQDIPMDRRNIWEDTSAAAFVRSVARGNETVPTVRIGDVSLVNPHADEVIGILAEKAPALVPDDWEPARPGAVAQLMDKLLRGS